MLRFAISIYISLFSWNLPWDNNKYIFYLSRSLSFYLSGFPYYAQRYDPIVQTWNASSAVEPFSEFMFA